jgi:hypothetical protein
MPAKKPAVTFIRATMAGVAECLDCSGLSRMTDRNGCKSHAANTGHRVRFTVEDITVYERNG